MVFLTNENVFTFTLRVDCARAVGAFVVQLACCWLVFVLLPLQNVNTHRETEPEGGSGQMGRVLCLNK